MLYAQAPGDILLVDSSQVYTDLNQYTLFCPTTVEEVEEGDFFQGIDTFCFENYYRPGVLLADHYISKISFKSTSKYPVDMVLSYGASDLFVEATLVSDGKMLFVKKAGLFFDRSQRDMKEGNLTALSFKLQPGKTYHLYAHIKRHFSHFNASLNVDLTLFPSEFWHFKEQHKILFQGLGFGLMSMLSIFVLFFFFNNPKPEYFFYLCYITTPLLGFLILENVGGVLIFPENSFVREQIVWLPMLGLCSFYILFIRHYIDTPKFAPIWDRIASFIVGFGFFLALVIFLIPMEEYPFLFKYFSSIVVLITLYAAASSVVFFIREPSKLRAYLLLGTCLLFLGYVFHGINLQFELIQLEIMFIPFFITFLESLLFAMGLAHKMRLREDEKKSAEDQQLLVQKEKESLTELSRLKSRFFANISHEFRTPLSLILGPLDQFQHSAIQPNGRELGMMRRNARRLLQLINQVLDLSRMEAQKMRLYGQQSDLVAFLRTCTAVFQSRAVSKSIAYEIVLPTAPIPFFFDPDKLEKIVTNVLSNAFKFTPKGGRVSFSLEIPENESEAFAVLQIQDDGPGISPLEQERVFERFYQVEQGQNRYTEGTGIGLALARELTELHHGRLELESELGVGAIFRIFLPMGDGHLSENEKTASVAVERVAIKEPKEGTAIQQQQRATQKEDFSDSDKPKVLLVEDNLDLQAFIGQQLQSDYLLLQAVNGKEGLEKAKEHIPDLIISDIMMPEMDGLTLSKQLKSNLLTSHIPIILLTAKVGDAEKMEGLETGAIDYLAKPFDLKELRIRIQNQVQQVQAIRERFSQQVIQLEPEYIEVSSLDEIFLRQLTTFINQHLDDSDLSVERIASAMALSRVQVHRKMKGLTGMATSDFLRLYRLKRAKQLISQQYGNMSEVAYATGFSSPAQFSRSFKKEFDLSPSDFAKKLGNEGDKDQHFKD